jgi:uncharacterized protein affecting Mg2+/Co2+ transport
MGGEETEAKLPIPGQEEQVSRDTTVDKVYAVAFCYEVTISAHSRKLAKDDSRHHVWYHPDLQGRTRNVHGAGRSMALLSLDDYHSMSRSRYGP